MNDSTCKQSFATLILLDIFFSRRYNTWWVLACFTILFHSLLSLHFSLQFLTFIFFKSSSTWSSHINLGLPTGLDEHGSHSVNFSTVLVLSVLITCAVQRNLCDFINNLVRHVPLICTYQWFLSFQSCCWLPRLFSRKFPLQKEGSFPDCLRTLCEEFPQINCSH